ncbi:hypothetical protein JYT16_01625 [Gemmatimonas aurantiaca]|nr:hypothetical protein [Gemmatimonas aurantiaca]
MPQLKIGSGEVLEAEGKRRRPMGYASADLLLSLDKKGKVSALSIECIERDTSIFYPFRKSLRKLRFVPAQYQGKKIPFELSGVLTIRGRYGSLPELLLPVNAQGKFVAPDLGAVSAEANGFSFARVLSFPPYFFNEPKISADTGLVPALALMRVRLDEDGGLLQRELIFTNDSALGEMALIAAGWAEYQPAIFKGEAVASSLLLALRFFTELSYPTPVWNVSAYEELLESDQVLESQRVQSFPDAEIVVIEPEIRQVSARVIVIGTDTLWQSVEAKVGIRKFGAVELGVITGIGNRTSIVKLKKRLENLRMYPALSFHIAEDGTLSALDTLYSVGIIHLQAIDTLTLRARTSFRTIIR